MKSCMYLRVFPTLSLSFYRGFFLSLSPPRLLSAHGRIFLPLLRLSCLPSLFNQAHSVIRVARLSFSFSSLSLPLFYVSLPLCSTRLDTIGYARSLSHTILRSPLFPSSPPCRPLVLISVLGRRACTHTAYLRRSPVYTRELSLSSSRAVTNTDIACARERYSE